MNLPENPQQSKAASTSTPPTSTASPTVPPTSRRLAMIGCSPGLQAAGAVRFRVRITWRDTRAPSGAREHFIHLRHPARVLELLGNVEARTPDLIAVEIEAIPVAPWERVTPAFVAWAAERRTRRDEVRRQMERRGALGSRWGAP